MRVDGPNNQAVAGGVAEASGNEAYFMDFNPTLDSFPCSLEWQTNQQNESLASCLTNSTGEDVLQAMPTNDCTSNASQNFTSPDTVFDQMAFSTVFQGVNQSELEQPLYSTTQIPRTSASQGDFNSLGSANINMSHSPQISQQFTEYSMQQYQGQNRQHDLGNSMQQSQGQINRQPSISQSSQQSLTQRIQQNNLQPTSGHITQQGPDIITLQILGQSFQRNQDQTLQPSPGNCSRQIAEQGTVNPFSLRGLSGITIQTKAPEVTFAHEPTEKYRFRYKSEMEKHGQLTSDTSPGGFPVVEVRNIDGNFAIKVELYTWEENLQERQRHEVLHFQGESENSKMFKCTMNKDCYQAELHSIRMITLTMENLQKDKKLQLKEAQVIWKQFHKKDACLRVVVMKNNCEIGLPTFSRRIQNYRHSSSLKIHEMTPTTTTGNQDIWLIADTVKKGEIDVHVKQGEKEHKCIIKKVWYQHTIICELPEFVRGRLGMMPVLKLYLRRKSDGATSNMMELKLSPTDAHSWPAHSGDLQNDVDAHSSGALNFAVQTAVALTGAPQASSDPTIPMTANIEVSPMDCQQSSESTLSHGQISEGFLNFADINHISLANIPQNHVVDILRQPTNGNQWVNTCQQNSENSVSDQELRNLLSWFETEHDGLDESTDGSNTDLESPTDYEDTEDDGLEELAESDDDDLEDLTERIQNASISNENVCDANLGSKLNTARTEEIQTVTHTVLDGQNDTEIATVVCKTSSRNLLHGKDLELCNELENNKVKIDNPEEKESVNTIFSPDDETRKPVVVASTTLTTADKSIPNSKGSLQRVEESAKAEEHEEVQDCEHTTKEARQNVPQTKDKEMGDHGSKSEGKIGEHNTQEAGQGVNEAKKS